MQANQKDNGGLLISSADSGGDEIGQDVGKYDRGILMQFLRDKGYRSAYGIDPGDITGVCILHPLLPGVSTTSLHQANFFEFLKAYDKALFSRPIVFYEGFVSRPAQFSRTQLAPQNIGAIKLWAHLNGFKAIEVQPAQTHKIRREDVKAAGWVWNTEHEFDAIRILIYGLTMLRYR